MKISTVLQISRCLSFTNSLCFQVIIRLYWKTCLDEKGKWHSIFLSLNYEFTTVKHAHILHLCDGFQNFEKQGHFFVIASDITEIKGFV